jgi:release factor glutamine methyltransferase
MGCLSTSSCILHRASAIFFPVTIIETINKAATRLQAHQVDNARRDAELLLCHILGRDRAWLLAHIQDEIDGQSLRLYERVIDRRAVREPLQYITGKQEFWGLPFKVTPDVLIPRPETEFVVEAALKAVSMALSPVIIDLCTGSGCIAISLAKELPNAQVFATDQSEQALVVAQANARMHQVTERIRFLLGNLFVPVKELNLHGKADVITANPPYIPASDFAALQPEVRDFEPEMALIAGPQGIEIGTAIIQQAPLFLKQGGTLIMEMGMGQTAAFSAVVKKTGAYKTLELVKDLAGIERVLVARKA